MFLLRPLLQRRLRAARNKKIFVGLSGGVDSAVSAALLVEQGYEVTGVFIKIQIPGYPCPAAVDRLEAMRVAAHLGIPFIEKDLSREYREQVFEPSIQAFTKGNTPNPDTACNEKIKFGVFFDFCISQGADMVATGHYAQVREGKLFVGADPNKDQSYFLWAVREAVLGRVMFPVGNIPKPQVRALAKKFGLPNAQRHDSQGLCFLGDISLEDMLVRETEVRGGDVLNEVGEVVGAHQGAALYTLGQRHGFELYHTKPDTAPHYVVAKDTQRNTITVSPQKFPRHAKQTLVYIEQENWIGAIEAGVCMARYRYRQTYIPALLRQNKKEVVLEQPHYIPLGQSLVLYRGERCLGGGVVDNATLVV